MATGNISTTGGYRLAPEIAAALRVPPINYPAGVVPHRVIQNSVVSEQVGLTQKNYPALAGDMHIQDVLDLLNQHAKGH